MSDFFQETVVTLLSFKITILFNETKKMSLWSLFSGFLACPFNYKSNPLRLSVEVRNRFRGLDLIDRVPDELWTKVHDIAQETGIKAIPKKGEKERYTHLNAEFQRIARRDKKAFLSNQCKEIEENNRMERPLWEKVKRN